ncbi:DUF123 domain-containing protein [Sulfurisphaera javensis]|uniref:DUF123 domain-containing protein n=1 Tax=Sulfurisphaera javensis TaxID=2049879 RepID=A0AAT9GTH6_9CREN
MKGYIVVFKCDEGIITTKTYKFVIKSGFYAYVGSCGVNCGKRISRHLLMKGKKKHWHVDYLSDFCEPLFAIILPLKERDIVKILLLNFDYVKGFGSTDDKQNPSHLFKVSLISLLSLIRGISE